MTTATANEPVSGYDSLKTKEVIASLSSHSQVELAEIESYERTHQDRLSVFDKLRWLRQDEPLPGYDALSSDEVLAALEAADRRGDQAGARIRAQVSGPSRDPGGGGPPPSRAPAPARFSRRRTLRKDQPLMPTIIILSN